jgi:hypothetical protein
MAQHPVGTAQHWRYGETHCRYSAIQWLCDAIRNVMVQYRQYEITRKTEIRGWQIQCWLAGEWGTMLATFALCPKFSEPLRFHNSQRLTVRWLVSDELVLGERQRSWLIRQCLATYRKLLTTVATNLMISRPRIEARFSQTQIKVLQLRSILLVRRRPEVSFTCRLIQLWRETDVRSTAQRALI